MRRMGMPLASMALALAACNSLTGVGDLMPCVSCGEVEAGVAPPDAAKGDSSGAADSGVADAPDARAARDGSADAEAGIEAGIGCPGAADCERVAFVTSLAFKGAIGGIGGADTLCQTAADVSSSPRIKGRRFLAWISTAATSPAVRFTHGVKPYLRPDGLRIANDWTDLTDSTLNHGIGVDETGADRSAEGLDAWTGTSKNGAYTGQACADWTSAAFADRGDFGIVGSNGANWSAVAGDFCSSLHSLYCFEK